MTRSVPNATGRGDEERAATLDGCLEELAGARGGDELSITWLAERLREFVDAYPEFEIPVDRFATWLARLPDDD